MEGNFPSLTNHSAVIQPVRALVRGGMERTVGACYDPHQSCLPLSGTYVTICYTVSNQTKKQDKTVRNQTTCTCSGMKLSVDRGKEGVEEDGGVDVEVRRGGGGGGGEACWT